jgi:hypothetical protein
MSLLTNAKSSIIMGLEDYSSSRSDRIISCTRNLFAGILLLFKHKLNILSPSNSKEALVKEKVIPKIGSNGQVKWVGNGKKTVNVPQIRKRFDSLGISVNWERVDNIRRFRNNVEHYYTGLSKDAMRDLISNSFLIIRDFVSQHLDLDPKIFLGEQVSTPENPVNFNFVEVSFESVRDDAERQSLNNIGTNFHLKDEQVDLLISAAGKVLHESPEFQAFLERNNGRNDEH